MITSLIRCCYNAGHFLPEEDDKFLEQVKAAVEDEERQAMAAADTDAAKDAIATAEVSRKTIKSHAPDSEELNSNISLDNGKEDQKTESKNNTGSMVVANKESGKHGSEGPGSSVANLPMEFYHYYHGSNTDMGTLIEVISKNTFGLFYFTLLHRFFLRVEKLVLHCICVMNYIITISSFFPCISRASCPPYLIQH